MWFDHLKAVQDNRRRGASKAAKTRKEKGKSKTSRKCIDVSTIQNNVQQN